MPGNVRDLARPLVGRLAPGYIADRSRRHGEGVRNRAGITRLANEFAQSHGAVVSGGPFAGLAYLPERLAEVDAPIAKLVGGYEHELHASFAEELRREPPAFVDVGCADGYYAVGVPLVSRQTISYAFDIASSARDHTRALAAHNSVEDRIRIAGRCDARRLAALPLEGALLLCDIEGAERQFFSERVMAGLARTSVLVEVHEGMSPGTQGILRSRFAPSHDCRTVAQAPNDPGDYPALLDLSITQQRAALSELRADEETCWLHLVPR